MYGVEWELPSTSPVIPTWCPTIQFNSDPNDLELAQAPQVKGSVSQDCPHFRQQLQVSGIPKLHAILLSQLQIQGLP